MSTHPSSPGKVAAEKLLPCPFCGDPPQIEMDECKIYCGCGLWFGRFSNRSDLIRRWNRRIDSASRPAAGWASLESLQMQLRHAQESRDYWKGEANATLRRSQPVQGLEDIARKATKSAWRSVNRRIISFDSFKASVEPFILRACQAAVAQSKKGPDHPEPTSP